MKFALKLSGELNLVHIGVHYNLYFTWRFWRNINTVSC